MLLLRFPSDCNWFTPDLSRGSGQHAGKTTPALNDTATNLAHLHLDAKLKLSVLRQAYVDTVVKEIGASAPLTDQPLKSVFFGGGTPSLIVPKQLDQVRPYMMMLKCLPKLSTLLK